MGAFLALAALATGQTAPPRPNWRDQYDAMEYMIPMRDGVKLATVVFVPKDRPGPFPILMERTPYGAGRMETGPRRNPRGYFESGYIMAFQDVRGRNRSEGDFENVRPTLKPGQKGIDEASDTYDTVEFLVNSVPKNSKRVGLWGISYPGFYAGAGAIRTHPSLVAVSPQAPVNDWFLGDDVHHNGAFFLQETFDFALGFDVPRGQPRINVDRGGKAAYDFYLAAGALSNYDPKFLQGKMPYWQELMSNTTYNDYWKDRALWRAFKGVKCAVLTVGGWFDKEDMWGALNLYKASEKQNRGIPNFLVMGPWSHGQWAGGDGSSLSRMAWGTKTAQWYQENLELPFFDRFLKGDTSVKPPAEATMFETGTNEFRTFEQWPPKGLKSKSIYLGPSNSLSFEKPKAFGLDTYVADPAKPNPYVEDYQSSIRAPGDWLARDQKFGSNWTGQVTYALPPLANDWRVAGPVEVDLWVTTTGTDGDFVVKVLDEFPADTDAKLSTGESAAGYQLMVRSDIMRGKFRNSFEKPEPFVPGKPTRVKFMLNDVLHTFKKGHRILVRVQSYWFPIADRNPNVFMEIPQAKDSDFRSANVAILHGGKTASSIRFGELK
jgi:uncharacterized protein